MLKCCKREVSAGELFVIREGERTAYRADLKDLWKYAWIAFRGKAPSYIKGEYKCSDFLIFKNN